MIRTLVRLALYAENAEVANHDWAFWYMPAAVVYVFVTTVGGFLGIFALSEAGVDGTIVVGIIEILAYILVISELVIIGLAMAVFAKGWWHLVRGRRGSAEVSGS